MKTEQYFFNMDALFPFSTILCGLSFLNFISYSFSGGGYADYDRFRRGGGSRMAASLGVGTSSPLVSPERSDSESSSKFNLGSAFHRNSRTLG